MAPSLASRPAPAPTADLRIRLEAIEPLILSRGIETEAESEAHLREFQRLETDSETMIVKFPDLWVIALR